MSNRGVRIATMAAMLLWCAAFGLAYSQQAQNPAPLPAPKPVTRIVHVNHVLPRYIAEALSPFTKYELATVVANDMLHTITLSGAPETVSAIEAAIRDLDVAPPAPPPARNIVLTADLILASEEKQAETPIPARLEPSLKQLRANFSYKTYHLLDTMMLGGVEGREASSNGSAILPGTDKEMRIAVSYDNVVRGDQESKSVYLRQLKIGLEVPVVREEPGGKGPQTVYRSVGFNTNLEVSEGQQMVVGKAGLGSGWALIAVISVKIE